MPSFPVLTNKRWQIFAIAGTVGVVAVAWFVFGIWSTEWNRWTGEASIPSEAKVPAQTLNFTEKEVESVTDKMVATDTTPRAKPLVGGAPIGFAPGALNFDDPSGATRSGARNPERAVQGGERYAVAPPDVREEIEKRSGAFVSAYEKALRDEPKLRGTIEVAFTLQNDGSLTDVAIVRDDVGSAEINDRITTAMSSWKLPPPVSGPIRIKTPLKFRQVR